MDNVDIIDKKLFNSSYHSSNVDDQLSSNLKCILSNIPIKNSEIGKIKESGNLTTRQKVVLDFIEKRMEKE